MTEDDIQLCILTQFLSFFALICDYPAYLSEKGEYVITVFVGEDKVCEKVFNTPRFSFSIIPLHGAV
ncbi:MAG: hypothetical protein IKH26_13090 [Bacteroidaceae bacterium]|nr:hypothetical protein [Bacteroidaceae bacterium]